MGKRSGFPHTEAKVAELTAEEIDAEIRRLKVRLQLGLNSQLRKSCQESIHRLERIRRRKYGDS